VVGPCDNLPQATASLVEEPDDDDDDDDLRKRALCEYATWCITNNPHQRAVFDEAGGGTRSRGGDSRVGVSVDFGGGVSSHLHRRVFANERNHPSFIRAGTVQALADVIVKSATAETPPPFAVRSMWAMAALRNLEASYCDREDDGRCYWAWDAGDGDHRHDGDENNSHELTMEEDSLPLLSDGSSARRTAMEIPNLVAAL